MVLPAIVYLVVQLLALVKLDLPLVLEMLDHALGFQLLDASLLRRA